MRGIASSCTGVGRSIFCSRKASINGALNVKSANVVLTKTLLALLYRAWVSLPHFAPVRNSAVSALAQANLAIAGQYHCPGQLLIFSTPFLL